MALPKNPWLLAMVATIWIGGNVATLLFGLQKYSWFGLLVFSAIALTFTIGAVDYWMNREAYDAVARRRYGAQPLPRWAALAITSFFGAVSVFAGVYNIVIGNVPGGIIVTVMGLIFGIGGCITVLSSK